MDLALLAIAALALALACAAFALFAVELPAVPVRGQRGTIRARARRSGGFRALELLVRVAAAHVRRLATPEQRRRTDEALVRAGEVVGLTADEFLGLRALSAVAGLTLGLAAVVLADLGVVTVLVCTGLGAWLPASQRASAEALRYKLIDRALPGAIDLAAMCMGAGLDFPGAIDQVARNMPRRGSPLRDELERMLQELSLGRTRKQSLQAFAHRAPTEAVSEFVNAVIQGEEKGTPLAEVLSIQAGALRLRRSVMAEEAAARAGVMMILPMMMLFGTVLLLVLGPLFMEMSGGALS